jgi:hypothetical protein
MEFSLTMPQLTDGYSATGLSCAVLKYGVGVGRYGVNVQAAVQ